MQTVRMHERSSTVRIDPHGKLAGFEGLASLVLTVLALCVPSASYVWWIL